MGNHITAHVKLEHDVYFPGNVVRGEATIKLDNDTECIAGRISCRGIERAVTLKEFEQTTYPVSQETVFYKETLTMFGHKVGDKDATPVTVPKGTYTYPFAFQLPMDIPGSMSHVNWSGGGGEVKYTVMVYLKMGPKQIDEGHHEFTVVAPLNQRDRDAAPQIEKAHVVEKLHTFMSDRGSCSLDFKLNRALFAPGDEMEGTVHVDNTNGTREIEHVKIAVRARTEGKLDEAHTGIQGGMIGSATSDSFLRHKVPVNVGPGGRITATFKLKIPNTIPVPSYPARGIRVHAWHELFVDVDGGTSKHPIRVPLHIAATVDPENRFVFHPLDKPMQRVSGSNPVQFEHAYALPEGFASAVCPSLQPPEGLQPQQPPKALTPQACGDGHLA